MIRTLVSRRYIAMTLLVLAAMAVMARLGVWQLDRRQQRLARNAAVVAKLNEPPLSINDAAAGLATIPAEREDVRDTRATAIGSYDYAHEVIAVQQVYQDSLGSRLVTPLILDGTNTAILIDRGWIPADDSTPERWAQYDTGTGTVEVSGFLQPTQQIGRQATPDPNQPVRLEWYQVDVPAIAAQLPYEVLPVFLLQSPQPGGDTAPPFREDPEIDLSEGPHLGYAIQWFSFAIVAGVVYVRVVSQREKKAKVAAQADNTANLDSEFGASGESSNASLAQEAQHV